MTSQELLMDQISIDLLATKKPFRLAVFLRTGSPLYSEKTLTAPWEGVVTAACSTLKVHKTEAKLMVVQKVDRMWIFVLDLYHDNYDWATAHNLVELPAILINYGKRRTYIKWVGRELRNRLNKHVAEQHRLHGWGAHPPYFEDQSRTRISHPSYRSPRNLFPGPPAQVEERGACDKK
ncbi:hypothetical protein F5Y03DRAFT_338126 [Xylaria venustula]|nr:hypothetical protein F5Y03DRAFT_338126 [Xylaria venustula]